jgi:inosine-uridine nucleoside N-ribohydrolase
MRNNLTATEIESRPLPMNALMLSCRHRYPAHVRIILCLMVLAMPLAFALGQEQLASKSKPIPVIFDTDIGNDIDDTWALGFLLKCPELDLKLAVGDRGRAPYRAKLLAKFLQRVGRTDVPVGVGLDIKPKGEGRQAEWVKDYDLKSYPGKVFEDGVQAIIDTIMKSDRPMTLICVGPVPNIAEALKREPRIAQRARFVGMHGSLRKGYDGQDKPVAEANVKCDPKACQAAFAAPWDITITPLDTCGLVALSGDKYRRVRDSRDPVASNIIANYGIWAAAGSAAGPGTVESRSSILFDPVAVYLAFRQDYCVMEKVGVRVTDNGFTVEDPAARPLNVATSWKDLDAFEEFLVQRLTAPAASR